MDDADMHVGLYQKYYVRRVADPEGKHDDCGYFVLDPQHDKFAESALRYYSEICQCEYPLLSVDIDNWLYDIILRRASA